MSIIQGLKSRLQATDNAASYTPSKATDAPRHTLPAPVVVAEQLELPLSDVDAWISIEPPPATVAINPPEVFREPVTELVAETTKKQRGRPSKQVVPMSSAPQETTAKGFTLYVDCMPLSGFDSPVNVSAYVAQARDRLRKEGPFDKSGAPFLDFSSVPFGDGVAFLTKYVEEQLGNRDVFLSLKTREGNQLFGALSALAATVVIGV